MAGELSSNWKKLQAKIKAEPPSTSSSPSAHKIKPNKRKARDGIAAEAAKLARTKKQKLGGEVSSSSPHISRPTTGPESTQMGVTQSSAVTKGTPATITPSLALWAEDNDISPEDLAEAYSLGLKPPTSSSSSATSALAPPVAQEQTRENEGLAPGVEVGKYVALDCEMVGLAPDGFADALARVSMVDFHGRQVYDSYVRPRPGERVSDYRTAITGIAAGTLRGARNFDAVQAEIAALLRGRVLVGHDLRHDLAALRLRHPRAEVRDTARFAGYRALTRGRWPALRVLARDVLGLEIQAAEHSSVEDARVAMLLFRRKKPEFDVAHAARYGIPEGEEGAGRAATRAKGKWEKKKKKKKR
ncbi:ribonuclease H-like domain-containing protein [Biscogniauxia marginata]|nr:ribonuclease H-like domain-containing protein [Biscogniauxia marginata]